MFRNSLILALCHGDLEHDFGNSAIPKSGACGPSIDLVGTELKAARTPCKIQTARSKLRALVTSLHYIHTIQHHENLNPTYISLNPKHENPNLIRNSNGTSCRPLEEDASLRMARFGAPCMQPLGLNTRQLQLKMTTRFRVYSPRPNFTAPPPLPPPPRPPPTTQYEK